MTARTAVATDEGSSSRLLILTRDRAVVDGIKEGLVGTSIDLVRVVDSRADAISFLEQNEIDVVAIHPGLPDWDGVDLARYVLERWPTLWIILIGPPDDDLMMEALRSGVRDYVVDYEDEHAGVVSEMVEAIRRAALRG